MAGVCFNLLLLLRPTSRPTGKAEDSYLIPLLAVLFLLFIVFGIYSYWQWKKEKAIKQKKD